MSYKSLRNGRGQSKDAQSLGALVKGLDRMLSKAGTDLSKPDLTRAIISNEALNDVGRADFVSHEAHIDSQLIDILAQHGVAFESLTEAQKDAGRQTLIAAGDPLKYLQAGYGVQELSQENFSSATVVTPVMNGVHGGIDYRYEAAFSLESFNESEIRQHLGFSVIFNIMTARQGDGAEALYPTLVLTPDQAGVEVIAPRLTVFNEVRYKNTGETNDWNRSNVIDALTDPTILADNSTEAVPVYVSGTNASLFSTRVPDYDATVNGSTFRTRPLAFDVGEFNLLGLVQNPGLSATGVFDNTDELSARIGLKNIYIYLTDDTSPAAVTDVVQVPVGRLPRSYFVKSVEGTNTEMTLTFKTDDIVFTPATLAIDAATPAALDDVFANAIKKIRFSVRITGDITLENGNMQVTAASIQVRDIYNADGVKLPVSGTNATDLAKLTAYGLDSYDLDAFRTSLNRRTRGLIVDTREVRERYTVGLLPPISTPRPVTTADSGTEIANVIATARIRNDNNAYTRALNYADTLKAFAGVTAGGMEAPVIEGIGRYLVKPTYVEVEADLTKVVNSIKTHEKSEDVEAALVNAVKAVAYRAALESRYLAALDATSGGVAAKPQLVIVTDPETFRYLNIKGDTRLAGVAFDTRVAVAHDVRLRGKILVTFSRVEATGQPDPLSFGFHAWIPELASTVVVSRNGGTTRESMVQPRSLHVNTCPILGVVNVLNAKEAMSELTPMPWEATP